MVKNSPTRTPLEGPNLGSQACFDFYSIAGMLSFEIALDAVEAATSLARQIGVAQVISTLGQGIELGLWSGFLSV